MIYPRHGMDTAFLAYLQFSSSLLLNAGHTLQPGERRQCTSSSTLYPRSGIPNGCTFHIKAGITRQKLVALGCITSVSLSSLVSRVASFSRV
jgi:hypothetical protein